ncbi:hypothetical protein BVG16_06045 [Paenibacillus selenitireducens]|uniref:BioF2-like acetyltransferase domain-containing protein n=1 Tax=Paenibacillus selenitireducens TaxID=1324314 RepID=A0A1T2XKB8_9BACL|nr:GNAT family N-acetyltransferase [Paenibacillus selenitireducens]OPA80294.1 hypothetical protein BVG16_06045 [Paenibacillus selenitireducens]
METSIIRSVEELYAFEKQWRDLLLHVEKPEIFASWEWLQAYVRHLLDPKKELFIIVVTDQDKCVAIAPLCKVSQRIKWRTVNALQFIVYDTGESNNFYFHREYHGKKLVKMISGVLLEHQDEWEWIELYSLQSNNPNTALIKQTFSEQFELYERQLSSTPYIDKDTYLLQKIDKSKIKDIERRERKLRREHEVKIRLNQPYDERIWDNFSALHKQRWQDSLLNKADHEAFIKEIIHTREQNTHFSYIEIDGQIAVGNLDVSYGDKVYLYMMASPKLYAEYGLGLILTNHVVKSYLDSDLREIDFLSGNQEYKFYWADSIKINYHFRMFNRSRKRKLLRAYSLFQIIKPRLKSLLLSR